MGETFTLTVSVTGQMRGGRPDVPGLEEFQILGQSSSNRVQLINGQMSVQTATSYTLAPRREGTFTLGPAALTSGGAAVPSNAVTITVEPMAVPPQGQPAPVPAPGGQSPAPSPQGNKEAIFLESSLSSPEAYPGQEILYKLTLYFSRNIGDLDPELPQVSGLAFRQIGKPAQFSTTVNGAGYNAVELSFGLTAQAPGDYALPAARMRMNVVVAGRGGGIFDDPFFGMTRAVPHEVESQPLQLTVKPFPEQGRPADFGGLVGDFAISAALRPGAVKAGESATLAVTLSGKGNARLLPDLKLPDIPGVKVYGDQPVFEEGLVSGAPGGKKTLRWALVPQNPGTVEIPVVGVSFFDPAGGVYKTLRTDPLALTVEPGTAPQGAAAAVEDPGTGRKKTEVAVTGQDILPVKEPPDALRPPLAARLGLSAILVLFGAPALPLLAGLGARAVMRRRGRDNGASLRKKALAMFNKTRRALRSGDAEGLHKAFCAFLNQRLGRPGGGLGPAEARDALLAAGADAETAKETEALLARLDALVFAGAAAGGVSGDMAEEAERLARRVDKAVKG
jgi:hypothetical protein